MGHTGDCLKEVVSEHNRCVEGAQVAGKREVWSWGRQKGGDMARGKAWKALRTSGGVEQCSDVPVRWGRLGFRRPSLE